jgi:hypothetical protein
MRTPQSLLFLITVTLLGCGERARAPLPAPPDVCASAPVTTVDFVRDVQPVLEQKCVTCHRPGGAAPFSLADPVAARANAAAIRSAVCSRTMPPWPPSAACNTYQHDRSLTEAQMVTLRDWVESGADITGAVEHAPAPLTGLSRIDLELSAPEAYRPTLSPDDYRCFVLDWEETQDRFVTGFGVTPDQADEVHHVILYRVAPSDVAAITAADAAEPGPGYTCFGGPNPSTSKKQATVGVASIIGVWAPGAQGFDFPAGIGVRVVPRSKLVMQVHYHAHAGDPTPDLSTVQLKLDDAVAREAFVIPFLDPNWARNSTMNIAAGEKDAFHAYRHVGSDFTNRITNGVLSKTSAYEVHGAVLHMHTRGTWASLSVERAQTSQSQCLLELPKWDFHWQGMYLFEKPQLVDAKDDLRVECHWDNSAAGAKALNWGEGTDDEMCLGFVLATAPQ